MTSIMHSFEEIGLLPAALSSVEHREDVDPYKEGKLPIFVAPMTCILDRDNFDTFNSSKFIPILPVSHDRLHTLDLTEDWQALTLQDFAYFFNGCKADEDVNYHILIDCANGNMESIFASVRDAKQEYSNITIMIGNIANPDTYLWCCEAGVDYVRVGIGGGSGCTTSVQTGIHASLPWLLEEISLRKKYLQEGNMYELGQLGFSINDITRMQMNSPTKIVADGGITNISEIIKALALGADYVMCGKLFAHCIEACGEIVTDTAFYKYRKYYGQASAKGQMDRFGEVKSNPEGTELTLHVSDNLENLTERIVASLRSAMSYAGAKYLTDFIGKVNYQIMSLREFSRYDK